MLSLLTPKGFWVHWSIYLKLDFSTPDASYFLEDILQWIRGKNVFIEEDCMIVNFGFVYKKYCACLYIHNSLKKGRLKTWFRLWI